MKKRIQTFIRTLILTLLFSNSIFAQVPAGFSYQAIARDANGELLAGQTLAVEVSILSGGENGILVWQEMHETTTSKLGLINLVICGDNSLRTGGLVTNVSDIPWASGNNYIGLKIRTQESTVDLGATKIQSVPYSLLSAATVQQSSTLSIQPSVAMPEDEALFIVKRSDGYPIFAVYESGVHVFTDTASTSGKGLKGGFAVGGYTTGKKGLGQTYLSVTPDSTRINVNSPLTKGLKGGFAVGGYTSAKQSAPLTLLSLSPDSARIYVDDDPTGKGLKGGFAVGGYTSAKGVQREYFRVTQDSTRVYLLPDNGKGRKGGFAVGGYTTGKAASREFLRVTGDSTRVYVNADRQGKGLKGGFAVGGYTTGKADASTFMTLEPENYFIGHNSGGNITTGLYNSVMGYESGLNITSGLSNSFIGYQAGYLNATGTGNLFLGYQSGYNNIEGNYNTFIGYRAGNQNNQGINNTFMGSFSGQNNLGGSFNTFIGDSAGYSNTNGYSNTFLGTAAGYSNTEGFSNVMLGTKSGYSNNTGDLNVFIGHLAGYENVNAGGNVFIGNEAGKNSIDGWNNIFMGTRAGFSNTDGEGNVILGYSAGFANEHGSGNVFIGSGAGLKNVDAGDNVYIGSGAGNSAVNGWNNIYLGTRSGYNNIDGQGNVMLGYEAGYSNQNGDRNIFIGSHAGRNETSTGRLYINDNDGDSTSSYIWGNMNKRLLRFNADVGVRTNPFPGSTLSVFSPWGAGTVNIRGGGESDTDYARLILSSDTTVIKTAYSLSHSKNNGIYLGYVNDNQNYSPRLVIDAEGRVGINGYAGTNSMIVHDYNSPAVMQIRGAGNDWDYAMLKFESQETAETNSYTFSYKTDESFLLGLWDGTNMLPRFRVDPAGNFTINTWDAGTEVLDVNGNARFRGVGTATPLYDLQITSDGTLTTSTSDARLKTAFRPIANSLERVLQLEGVSFRWKDDESGREDVGLVAQDVEKVFPEAVFVNPNDGYMGVNYSRFPALLVEAIKEQQQVIDAQKSQLNEQELLLNELMQRIEKLEQTSN